MDIQFLLIQFIGLLPSVIAFTSLQTDNRKRILILQVFCCVLWGSHYTMLGAYTGLMINIIGLFRGFLCYHNDKEWANKKAWLYLLLVLYAGSALLTWDGWYCMLPSISMILATFGLWTHNMKHTRLFFLLNSPPLFLYNIISGSYSCAIIEVCAFISYVIAIYRFDIRKEKDQISTPGRG